MRDRGSVLMLMPAAVLIMMVLSAIAVDLSIVHLGEREAAAAATAAANDAVTQAIDNNRIYGDGTYVIDPVQADKVVRRSLTAQELTGAIESLDVSVDPTGTAVTVTIALRVDYIFARALPNGADGTTVEATITAQVTQG